MKSIDTSTVKIPLGSQAHQFAWKFATVQASSYKSKQVYLNTLAVYAVHRYLKRLHIETNLSQSDSWNPYIQVLFDIADLLLPGIGKLECRPVLPGETTFAVPPEVTQERIGYVAVQLNSSLDRAQLLGFAPTVDTNNPPEQIEVKDLMPRDILIDYITEREAANTRQAQSEKISSQPSEQLGEKLVRLMKWLQGYFEPEWQPAELLLASSGGYRGKFVTTGDEYPRSELEPCGKRIRLGKVIGLNSGKINQAVIFAVDLSKKNEEKVDICLSIYPYGNLNHLPLGLQLTVIEQSGKTFLEEKANKADNQKILKFDAELGEKFSVRFSLQDICMTEDFIVST